MSLLEDSVEFARNPDPRCPCLLLLDTSSSMSGQKIEALNAGIQAFRADIEKGEIARRRCEVAIITFGDGGVSVQQPFVTADQFQPPTLVAIGMTPMGEAILKGVELLNTRKAMYRQNATPYYRPWLLLITDGMPTDHLWQNAAQVVRQESDSNGLLFFPVGVEGADLTILELQWQFALTPTNIKTYRLYYHPDDRHIADDIVAALEKNPYLRRGTEQHIDYHIAILTSRVTVSSFNRLLNTAQHLVCIIGTNIQLPKDERPSPPASAMDRLPQTAAGAALVSGKLIASWFDVC